MDSLKEIFAQALKGIKPSKEEEKKVMSTINEVLAKINKSLKPSKAILGGSGAKGTWLKNAYDADIFVQFPYKAYMDKSARLSDILEKALKKSFVVERLHGSRDYFRIRKKEFTFEVIPILAIRKAEQAVNITDVSPLHAKYVKAFGKYADDI